MLKAEHIPDAVARLADEAYYDTAGDNPTMSDEDIMKHAIAAALNAWEGMIQMHHPREQQHALILPLPPQENSDD